MYVTHALPDRISGATAIDPAAFIEDDVSFQVSIVVVSGEVVGDDPSRNPQAAQD